MNSREKITRLQEIITAHELFEITAFTIHEPVSQHSLTEFESQYGFALDAGLAVFYSAMNGCTLTYKLKDSSETALKKFRRQSPFYPDINPIGSINFVSFEQAFLKDSWKGILYDTGSMSDTDEFSFSGEQYTYNSFGEKLKPFDTYSTESCAAMLLEEKNRFNVILLEDNYADWKNSRRMDFNTYFKFILLTGGLVQARAFGLSEIDGDTQPMFTIKNARSLVPKLFDTQFDDFLKD